MTKSLLNILLIISFFLLGKLGCSQPPPSTTIVFKPAPEGKLPPGGIPLDKPVRLSDKEEVEKKFTAWRHGEEGAYLAEAGNTSKLYRS